MKKLLTLALLFSGATSLCAQSVTSNPYLKQENAKSKTFRNYLNFMLSQQEATAHQKTTGLAERVIAESTYELFSSTLPTILDTTKYVYSGTNGSKFNFNMMDFKSNAGPDVTIYAYPYDWSLVPVMADTIRYWSKDSATAPLTLAALQTATFTADKKLASSGAQYFYMGMPFGEGFSYNTYNSQGKLVQVSTLSDFGMGLDTTMKIKLYYNTQGRLDKDSLFQYDNGQWLPMGIIKFTYDAAGNITSVTYDSDDMTPTWVTMWKYVNTFYNDNKIKTSTEYERNNNMLEAVRKDSLGYASNSSMVVYHAVYEMNNNNWELDLVMTKHLNAQGLPDTVSTSYYDAFTNTMFDYEKVAYSYTTYGNPQQGKSYFYNSLSWDHVMTYNFYYQIYNDPTSVKSIPAQEEMTVYPNPATSEININWKEGNGKKVSIEMVNAAGQKVMTASSTWKSESQAIPVQALTPGMYWLMVRNEAGVVIFRQAVVKQ